MIFRLDRVEQPPVRKLLASIASLMLVLTLWAGTHASIAYAAQIDACVTVVDGTSVGHAPGDGDEVPRDSDKASPHHHSTAHAHDLGVPARTWAATPALGSSQPDVVRRVAAPPSYLAGRDLRPPIA